MPVTPSPGKRKALASFIFLAVGHASLPSHSVPNDFTTLAGNRVVRSVESSLQRSSACVPG
jgi:hypothetical protein